MFHIKLSKPKILQIAVFFFFMSAFAITSYGEACQSDDDCAAVCDCVGEETAQNCTPDQGNECCACWQEDDL